MARGRPELDPMLAGPSNVLAPWSTAASPSVCGNEEAGFVAFSNHHSLSFVIGTQAAVQLQVPVCVIDDARF